MNNLKSQNRPARIAHTSPLRSACLLPVLLAACTAFDPATPTPTQALTGPTIAPSPQLFTGPPTEGPPLEDGSLGISDPTAAALPASGALPPRSVSEPGLEAAQPIEVVALDGALLTGTLYQSGTERQPGVLLLGPSAADWGDFPVSLRAAGFTVLVMTLRDGGTESDVQVMIDALASGTADPARIGAIGAAAGADVALRGCAITPACDTVVLLSPLDENPNVLAQFNPRPIMLAASEEDADSFAVAQALEAAATGDKLFQPLVQAGQGTALLANRPDLGGLIIDWLNRQLV